MSNILPKSSHARKKPPPAPFYRLTDTLYRSAVVVTVFFVRVLAFCSVMDCDCCVMVVVFSVVSLCRIVCYVHVHA